MAQAMEAAVHRARGGALLQRGLLIAARDEFLQWLGAAKEAGETAQMIAALNALYRVASQRGDYELGLRRLDEAQALVSFGGVPLSDCFKVYANRVSVLTSLGQLDAAVEVATQAEVLLQNASLNSQANYWLAVSVMRWRRQEWIGMRQAADRAYDSGTLMGDGTHRTAALLNRGIAHLELGVHRLAQRDLEDALRSAARGGTELLPYTYAELGRLHFLESDDTRALAAGREALSALFTRTSLFDKEEVARLSRLFGTIFARVGERNTALKYLNRAAAYFSQLGLVVEWQRSTEAISQVLVEHRSARQVRRLDDVHRLDFLTAILDLTDDMESVDPYLRGQGERVAALAVQLGEAVGLGEDELMTLNYAARLHDVGMVAVDSDLLRKKGNLTESERQRVAQHVEIGAEMVKPHGLLNACVQAIRHHHERFDGAGYPHGLAADEIPLLARITAIADAYDAVTSERPYRRALSHTEAVAELQAMAGNALDPVLFGRFRSLFDT